MTRRSAAVTAALLGAWLAGVGSRAVASEIGSDPEGRASVTNRLRDRVWNDYLWAQLFATDSRGRSPADDLRDWVMTPVVSTAIRGASTEDAAPSPADPELVRAGSQLDLIEYYWSSRTMLNGHRAVWQRAAAGAPDAARTASEAKLQTLESDLTAHVGPSATIAALAPLIDRLVEAYNAERERLARHSPKATGLESPAMSRDGPSGCHGRPGSAGAAPARNPGSGPPRIQSATSGLLAIYPVAARAERVWGNSRIGLTVNASGCVTSARLLDSSGSALLDAAALEWVDVAQLSPAREQGHPAAATAVVLVRFLLGNHANDDGVPAAALPHGAEASGPSVTQLSGIPLGISREQLRDLKGRPLSIQDSAWLYNSLDGAHDGVVTVMFHRSSEAGREIVVGIEYLGDKESAPPELPKLVGAAEPELVRRYGTPRMRELDPGGRRTLVFSNGTYARLHHDKVEAYGIVAVEEAGPLPDVTVFVEPDR